MDLMDLGVSAREQMKWQEYMSSSAHQREVEDLKKAGLNPVLSSGGSGASTPAGANDLTEIMKLMQESVTSNGKALSKAIESIPDIVDKLADSRELINDANREKHIDGVGFFNSAQAQNNGYYFDADKGKYVKDERLGYPASAEDRAKVNKELKAEIRQMPLSPTDKAIGYVAADIMTSRDFVSGLSNITSSARAYSNKKQQENVSDLYLTGF